MKMKRLFGKKTSILTIYGKYFRLTNDGDLKNDEEDLYNLVVDILDV